MLLVITNKLDSTTDVVIDRLNLRGIPFVRWNVEDMMNFHGVSIEIESGKIKKARLQAERRVVDLVDDVSVIWYRRPGKIDPHRSIRKNSHKEFSTREGLSILNNIWALLGDKVWVNKPSLNMLLNDKLRQLELAEQLGISTPPTLLTNNPAEVRKFRKKHGDIAVKSLSAGIIMDNDGEKMLYTHKLTDEDMGNLERIRLCPTLFQAYVPKLIELRITVVDVSVFACAIESQKSKKTTEDWRRYDFENVPHYEFNLPGWLSKKLVMFLQKSGLVFGAFDFILTPEGEFVFLEINTNGQWYWIEKLTGLPITDTLVEYFEHSINERR